LVIVEGATADVVPGPRRSFIDAFSCPRAIGHELLSRFAHALRFPTRDAERNEDRRARL